MNYECTICFNKFIRQDITFLNCKHYFCNNCLFEYKQRKNINCPMCRCDIKRELEKFKVVKYYDANELSEIDIDTYMCI